MSVTLATIIAFALALAYSLTGQQGLALLAVLVMLLAVVRAITEEKSKS